MKFDEPKNLEILFSKAESLRNVGKFQDAIESFKIILKSKTNSTPVLNGIANCYFQLNKFELAEEYYILCLKNEPLNTTLINNLSFLYLRTKNFKKALKMLEKSLQIKDDQENIVEKIGYCLIEMKSYFQAVKFCENYLKKYPKNNFLTSYYEKSLFKTGRNVEGLKLLKKQKGFIQFDNDKVKII